MSELFVRSPTQASEVYSLDGQTVARAKNLFYVRFRRPDTAQTGSEWQNNLGFIVKSIDRPSVTPTVEELNQYNKKRLVTTGFKVQPMRMTLYDTVDNIAMRMWDEYARYYYGDFNQEDESSYRYDITTPNKMIDNGSGFGYVPRPEDDLNSQFFFDALEVYQVFGGQFTQFDLINPRISQFDPDELDYSINDPATISITLSYESIKYRNNGRPSAISSNELMAAAFNGKFNGNGFDIEGVLPRLNKQGEGSPKPSYVSATHKSYATTKAKPSNGKSKGGGALSMFGDFDFGSLEELSDDPVVRQSIHGDVHYPSTMGDKMALGWSIGRQVGSGGQTFTPAQSIVASQFDALAGTVVAATGGDPYAEQYVAGNVLPAVIASSRSNGTTLSDEVKNGSTGLDLNRKTLAVANAQRPPSSQIGRRMTLADYIKGPVETTKNGKSTTVYNRQTGIKIADNPG